MLQGFYNGEYSERHLIKPGDVIVANTEQGHHRLLIGYAAIVPHLFGERGIASHHIYRLKLKHGSQLTGAFLLRLLNSPQMHDVISGYANGTTVNMLPISALQQPQIIVPPRALLRVFDDLATQVEARREERWSNPGPLPPFATRCYPNLSPVSFASRTPSE